MKRILLAVLVLGLFMVSGSVALAAKPDNPERVPYEFTVEPTGDYADPCMPEAVTFTGFAHITESTTEDSSGDVHSVWHMNVSALKGIGETSRDAYVGVGAQNEKIVIRDGESVGVGVGVYNGPIIKKGTGIISQMHVRASITVGPDGEPTVEPIQFRVECAPSAK